ncbi:MAG: nicotinate-nucleotide adenylyltransferase [Erysipelotrichaceae bacterium]|nr:nicotinate-nucleotide adenylyltransferase [Erysipelotrichaceae bacterium]
MRNIILFGGSFDPIHNGHLNMAKIAVDKLKAQNVIFIPNGVSVWKEKETIPEDKYQMIQLAIKGFKNLKVSRFELNRKDNYTIYTVRHFKEVYPLDNLYFLIGADQVNEFHRWKEAEEISKLVRIVYFKRSNVLLSQENIKKYNMQAVEGPEFDVSSTDVRKLQNIDIPMAVIEYIQDHNLYFMKTINGFIDGKRLEHSKSVAMLAYRIAIANGINRPWRAYIAGLLHDIGKNVDEDEKKRIEKEYKAYLPLSDKLYHQFYSAEIAANVFHITDEDIIEAIKYHATGCKNMNPLAMIVYASDKIDPKRGYDSQSMIDGMLADYKNGFINVLEENKRHLVLKNKDIDNKLTKECMSQYLK